MRDSTFMVIPAYMVHERGGDELLAAEAEARRLVEKDRVPRVVIQVHTVMRPSLIPRVDVTRFSQAVQDEVPA